MRRLFTTIIVLFATSCVLSACLEEEHLVPKHGIKSTHELTKRDLSAADAELILKALMSKLGHAEESELMHKSSGIDKEHYSYRSEMTDKLLEKDGYEVKKDIGISEKDMMDFLMKIKEMSASETLDDPYDKKGYIGNPEEKYISEKVHSYKGPITLEKSGKVYEDIVRQDKFSDKDVSLAESLYHMKIAGDVETYPAIKLAPLSAMYDKKKTDEKLLFEDEYSGHTDEAYLKKVDEIGKSLLKEESYPHLKDDDIDGYLKKAAAEDKSFFYEPKLIQKDTAIKTAEDKAIEEWKASHKDIFAIEGGIFSDEKLKMDGAHHEEDGIAYGMKEELEKKLKTSMGLDKEFKTEGSHHLEGGVAHEMNEELLKKLKETLGFDKELTMEGTIHAEGDIAHEISDELMKKLKASLGLDKDLVIEGAHHIDEGIAHKMNDELLKKLKTSLGFDKDFKMDESHHVEGGMAHEIDEELLKKLKVPLGLDKEFKIDDAHHLEGGVAHEIDEELLKKIKVSLGLDKEVKVDDAHYLEGGISHEINDELLKKIKKSLGSDISHDELFRLSKGRHNEEGIAEGSFAYEKAKEQAHKDVRFHLSDEELKKHLDEATSFGAKEKTRGTELLFEKGLKAEKAHGVESKIGSGVEKSLDGAFKDEILKAKETHAIDEMIFGSKVPEVKHAITRDSSVDKAIKVHEDEYLKKEKAYGADSVFYEDKEIIETAGEHPIMKEEDILHDSEIDKHHVEAGAEKKHKTLHDLKAKFFELLRRVLQTRKCHLVTMRPGELLSIVNCVSRSKDPRLCEKFAACEKKMPLRVIANLEKCQKETIPGEIKRCTRYAPLYPSTEIPLKIFQCVALNTRKLLPEEEKEMTAFEECARVIKAESCGRVKWFRRPH